jgi:hypothetical protein
MVALVVMAQLTIQLLVVAQALTLSLIQWEQQQV